MSQTNHSSACQQCEFADFHRAGNDGWDMVALLLSFLVLWVKPETTLFPTGLALYMIPCIFDAVKSSQRSNASWVVNWLHIASLIVLGAIAFLGVMGEIQCVIDKDVSVIVFSESFRAIIQLPSFRTLWFLMVSGTPLLFAGRKYIFPKVSRTNRSVAPQRA